MDSLVSPKSLSLVLALSAALSVTGCALPMEGEAADELEQLDEPRVFTGGEAFIDAAPEDFSFVIEADGPQVVLATLSGEDALATGEATWARDPSVGWELAMRREVDPQEVPVELLVRQGEAFMARGGDDGACLGYLGELSVVRLIDRNAVLELGELTDDEYDLLSAVRPTVMTGRVADPSFHWDLARRSYLVARWETDDDCGASGWGHRAEHGPVHFAEVSAEGYAAEARRLFRADPAYAVEQDNYDEEQPYLEAQSALMGSPGQWPEGPWDEGYFGVRAFSAPDGRRVVVASANQGGGCEGGPSALHLLFDATPDGGLALRRELLGVPYFDYASILEREGALHFLGSDALTRVEDLDEVQSVAPIFYGCGC